ncbi:DNA-binding protein [Bacillus pseudomycoides]|nr:DNA-binding protein [Bacillus pseudomycoides]
MNEQCMCKYFDKRQWVIDNVLANPEAIEFLGISRARLSTMIRSGKIVPAKKLGCVSLFLKSDLEQKGKELEGLRKKYRPYGY